MSNVSVLEINEAAVKYNLNYVLTKLNKNTLVLVVVKAFSYGSDSVIISTILQKNKINYLAVAYLDEGIQLRNANITLPIIVLHPQRANLESLIKYNLEPSIYSDNILEEFIKVAKSKNCNGYPIHLKFNTGLNRLGFHEKSALKIIKKIKGYAEIRIKSVFSHLAASEDLSEVNFTKQQINSFKTIKDSIEQQLDYKPLFHLSNTSGIINYPEAQFDMVRLGIGVYGFANDEKVTAQLKNVLSLKTIISQIHTLEKGSTVGYNRTFRIVKETKIATLPIGYADGISRQLGNGKSYVFVKNTKAFIIGSVCMDMIMVDVTNIACKEGDEVIIFNSQIMIKSTANSLETIPYEFLAMISQRVKRKLT